MYEYKQVAEGRFVLSVGNHQEIVEALGAFCEEKKIFAGEVRGLGAVSRAVFRFLDPATKKYVDKAFDEQMEITALVGNISEKDGKPYLHIHLTCGRRDYSCVGGHLLSARVNGACELTVDKWDAEVGRRFDSETGLNLYKL
ncbi:MAG: DNA-binding protein [Bacteroidales bacterium]|nr:DNA-binding protein [Bacteroidales bacterium]